MSLAVATPVIDYGALAPIFALAAGAILTLAVGLLGNKKLRSWLTPAVALLAVVVAGDLTIRIWGSDHSIVEGALKIDGLALVMNLIFLASAAAAIALSYRERAVEQSGEGEYYSLLLASTLGMIVLAASENMVTLFIGLELLSVPLYVLCGSELRRRGSLEAGLKYLIFGSVGAAVLLYGLAFIYGATGSTDFDLISRKLADFSNLIDDPLLLIGVGFVAVGLAFKASVAPFHQWTPDVYQGAPTAITSFMAVATKAAALAVFLRFFEEALIAISSDWQPVVAALAVITIVVGNVAAVKQDSLKRLLAYSGVAQAGYMLVGLVVASKLGLESLVFYLIAYLLMNFAAFAVVVARERETNLGDDIASLRGIGRERPLLAVAMTVAMLSLAGFPATVGFVGKFYLIEAAVAGNYTWLAVAIVVGTMISLLYYLRVVATIWLDDAPAAPLAGRAGPEVIGLAALTVAATFFFGIVPQPLLELAKHAGRALLPL